MTIRTPRQQAELVLEAMNEYLPDAYLEDAVVRAISSRRSVDRAAAMVDIFAYFGLATAPSPEKAPVHLSQRERRP